MTRWGEAKAFTFDSAERAVMRLALRRSRETTGRLSRSDPTLDLELTFALLDRYEVIEAKVDRSRSVLDLVERRLASAALREFACSTRIRLHAAETDVQPMLAGLVATAEDLSSRLEPDALIS